MIGKNRNKGKTYPKESSKTKGSMPARLLSVSVHIWLQQILGKFKKKHYLKIVASKSADDA